MSNTYVFYVDGMTCTSCSSAIENLLQHEFSDKLEGFNVDITTADPKKTCITLAEDQQDYEIVWAELKNQIEQTGFSCRDYEYQPEQNNKHQSEPNQKRSLAQQIMGRGKTLFSSHWFLGALGCVSGVAVLLICLTATGLTLAWMLALGMLSTVLTVFLGANSYHDAWSKAIKSRTLTMDSLFTLSTISILAVSLASLFIPWLPMMFEAGLLIYGFRHLGIAIEDSLKEKIGSARFQDRAAHSVRRQSGSGSEEIPLEQIAAGDLIMVNPGEIIPLDGICCNESLIYTTIITGANLPRYVPPHEKVLAGMRLAENAEPLIIRVTQTQQNSYLARLDRAIEKSVLEKAPIEIKTGRLLAYFIPTILLLAISSGLIISLFFPAAIAIQCALSVLVSACPCTLGLITPLAVKTGMHKAAEHGVQFKSAKALQQSEQIDTLLFDLNGTLTTGVPQVKEFYLVDKRNWSKTDFLSICSALEKNSHHPIGKAIDAFTREYRLEQLEASDLDESHHSGVTGQIMDEHYTIGSWSLMEEKGIEFPNQYAQPELDPGDQLIYVACKNRVVGLLKITDPLRTDALRTLNALRAMGKKIHLCTGADEETAWRYARALGIQTVYANCVATNMEDNLNSKPAHIRALREQGHKVAMIGDAGNDAQAIAASDLGLAVCSEGSDEITQQAADIVIQKRTLLPIASAFAVSKQTVANINQNLAMSMIYNLSSILLSGGLLLALGLTVNPVAGVALMIVQACFILMNVYRFKKQALTHLQEEEEQEEEQEYCSIESSHQKIWRHVPGHASIPGCDEKHSYSEEDSASYSFQPFLPSDATVTLNSYVEPAPCYDPNFGKQARLG